MPYNDSNILLLSAINSVNIGVIKLNSDGELLWEKVFGSDKREAPLAIKTNASNEIYFTGNTTGNYYDNLNKTPYMAFSNENDFFLTKLDPEGNMLSSKQYGSINRDNIQRMTIDNNNDVYMTGTVNGALDGNDYKGRADIFLMKVPH